MYKFAPALAQKDVIGHLLPIPNLGGLRPERFKLITVILIKRDVVQLSRVRLKVEQQIRISGAGYEL